MRIITAYRLLALFAIGIFLTSDIFSQTVGDYRTRADGNWNSANSWETYNGSTWQNAGIAPSSNSITAIDIRHAIVIADSTVIFGNTNVTIVRAGRLDIYNTINNRGTIVNNGILNWYSGNITTADSLIVGNILNTVDGSVNIEIFNDASTFNQRISNAGSIFKFGTKTLTINEFRQGSGIFDTDRKGIFVHYDGLLDLRTTSTFRGSAVNFGTWQISNSTGMRFQGKSFQNENRVIGNVFTVDDTEPQDLKGSGHFDRMTIRNPKGITIANDLMIDKELQLLWGKVNLSGNFLTLGTSVNNIANLVGGSDTAYFYNGGLRRWVVNADTVRFPIGTANSFLQALVVVDGLNNSGLLSMKYQITDPLKWGLALFDSNNFAIFNTCAACGVWEIQPSNGLTISTYRLVLTLGNYPSITQPSELRIIYRPDSKTPWSLTGAHDVGGGVSPLFIARRNSLSVFGEFAIGGGTTNSLLPVELTDFTAFRKGNTAYLKWETASERNTSYFDIERSSDARVFTHIGQIKAKGTTLEPQRYQFIDDKPQAGIQYYRLKIMDDDGKFDYSPIKSVLFDGKIKAWVYPNPFREKLVVETDNTEGVKLYDIEVTDAVGKNHFIAKGIDNQQFNLDLKHLAAGVYFAKVIQGRDIAVFKVVKN
jgi:hypothetical protein